MSRIFGRLALAALGIALMLALLEAGVRAVTALDRNYLDSVVNPPSPGPDTRLNLGHLVRPNGDPLLAYELRPGIVGRFLGKPVQTNSLGMRDVERTVHKPQGTFRIFGLGDSHTFGWGVARDEAFLTRIESALNERSTGPRFEAWNLAVPGYNSVQEMRVFERWKQAAPDLVLISFVDNDMHLPNFLYRRPDLRTLRKSYLLELVERRWASLKGERLGPLSLRILGPREQIPRDREDVPEEYRALYGWKNLEDAYRRLAAQTRSLGVPRAVLFTGNDPPDKPSVVALKRLCAEEGFVIIDPWKRIRRFLRETGTPAAKLAVSRSDPHASALMHGLIAEEIIERLAAAGAVPVRATATVRDDPITRPERSR